MLVLRGASRDIIAWNLEKQDENRLVPRGEGSDTSSISCQFDVPNTVQNAGEFGTQEGLGVLLISSTRIPTRDEGHVIALMLEPTGREAKQHKRVGIAVVTSYHVNSATNDRSRRTIKII